jgi:alanyl-tRNA synthetase
MFYDFEPDEKNRTLHAQSAFKNEPCHVNCDCGRFMEIGNNVFMEYKKTENGFEKLPSPNVDFGAGLERMAAALNNDSDMFRIDVFAKVIETIEKQSGKKYNPIPDPNESLGVDKQTQAFRVILDHLRAATFLIADGIVPGNKDQNYFVRRLLRRAIRFGKNLGMEKNFCWQIAFTYIEIYKHHYIELNENREKIKQVLEEEENKFRKTIDSGEKKLEKIINLKINDGGNIIAPTQIVTGEILFDLYQNEGFPLELSLEIIKELDKKLNGSLISNFSATFPDFLKKIEEEFNNFRQRHSEQSRSGSEQKFKGGLSDHSEMNVKYHTATHLLHQALKNVLGEDANQKGSNITPERLRFDFSYGQKMTGEQIKQTEDLVNEWIQKDLKVTREEMNKPQAEERNPIHLFGEKYGDTVSIYTIGDGKVRGLDATSVEFCGGPHVEHTGQIGEGGKKFKIVKEEAVSAGVRRIKAVVE